MLNSAIDLAPYGSARMAGRIVECVDLLPVPLRMVLGSQTLERTLTTLRQRIADFESLTEHGPTDFPPEK